jgi:hypothetical protein
MDIDPRGPRFAAAVTTVVLALVLLTGSWLLLAAQAVVFALSAANLRWSPYGWLYRSLVAPRLGPPAELEPSAPPRFSQGVGFAFAAVGVVGYLGGAAALGVTATALALAAAFLNAAFGLCLGCELYLWIRRIVPPRTTTAPTTTEPATTEPATTGPTTSGPTND